MHALELRIRPCGLLDNYCDDLEFDKYLGGLHHLDTKYFFLPKFFYVNLKLEYSRP